MNTFAIYKYKEKASGLFGIFRRLPSKELIGEIVFYHDKIIIAGIQFSLSEIDKIAVLYFDDYAERNYNGRPCKGDNNVMELYLSNGKKETYYFALEKRYQLRDVAEQFIAYYKAGKFDFDNLVAVLGLENYNAIQNFKNTLSIKSY